MRKIFTRRFLWFPFLLFCTVVSFATVMFLVLHHLRSHLVFFVAPSALISGEHPEGKPLRIGGIIVRETLHQDKNGVSFRIRGFENKKDSFLVKYHGPLPSLFAEGQGVLVDGHYRDNVFYGTRILAKHDEIYRP